MTKTPRQLGRALALVTALLLLVPAMGAGMHAPAASPPDQADPVAAVPLVLVGEDPDDRPPLPPAPAPGPHTAQGPLDKCPPVTGIPNPCDPPLPRLPTTFADPEGLALGWPTRTLDVAVSVSQAVVDDRGPAWRGIAHNVVNAVDKVYRDAVDIRVKIVDVHAHAPGTSLLNHYRTEHPDLSRDLLHAFRAWDGSGPLGVAHPETAGTPGGFSWSILSNGPEQDVGPFTFYGSVYVEVAAHEIGHTLSAAHEYANCAQGVPGYDPLRPVEACTVMWFSADLITSEFSTANRLAIRGYADDVGI